MSKKSFTKRMDEIIKAAKASSKDGKLKSSFSRKFYDDVAGAVMNDPDYVFDEVKVRNGEAVTVETKPSREFREKLLGPIAKGFNLDAEDAKKYIEDYEFTAAQASTIYDLMSAINWEYMNTGKILKMPATKEFAGAIQLRDVDESIYENEHLKVRVKRKKHKVLQKRSNTPAWCKESLPDKKW